MLSRRTPRPWPPAPVGFLFACTRLGLLLSSWAPAAVRAAATHVAVEGRRIVVDGKPVFLKGVNWNPVPKGARQGQGGVHFRGFAETDSELMAAAGINAVRTYEPIVDLEVLDILHRKGIYVLNTVYIAGAADPEDALEPVRLLKDHPAILMWVIGNEWNYNMLYSSLSFQQALERVRAVARLVKSVDRAHPVASVYGMVPAPAQLEALDEIDVWGLTAYTGLSFGNLFDRWAAVSRKPMFVAEYGADAYNAKTGSVDEADQAKATTALTQEVVRNSALHGGACSGGLIFELADEWWKDGKGSPRQHNKGGVAPGGGPFPDSTFNEEYWGLVTIDGTPRQAYAAYAAVGPSGTSSAASSPRTAPNISANFRAKACGANPACVGRLGDCCPGKDGKFQECCSGASKRLDSERREKESQEAGRRSEPEMTPNAHSHQTLWTAGAPPTHCQVDHVVPCCRDGDCGSCAGDQCCPSEGGSVTCPSASKAQADGCIHPKQYDCTGRTGAAPRRNASGADEETRHAQLFHKLHPGVARGSGTGTTPRPPSRPPTTTAKRRSGEFDAHPGMEPVSIQSRQDEAPPPPPSTTQGILISLHTTMKAPSAPQPSSAMPRPPSPHQEEVGAWILGPEKASCTQVCKSAGGCVEGRWPATKHDFSGITRDLGYSCFDLQDGGAKFDPSTQQGNCGWRWNGGRELLDADDKSTRCSVAAPAFTKRFCPCRGGGKHAGTDNGAEARDKRTRWPEKGVKVVMEKFPGSGDAWSFGEGVSAASAPSSLFT